MTNYFLVESYSVPLGLEDKRIPDTAITASFAESSWPAIKGRLNSDKVWCASSKADQYLQIDIGAVKMITKVATQGMKDRDNWVTHYRLGYSIDGIHWAFNYEPCSTKKVRIDD